ncbi:hypothetical protein [Piscinibacter koreensis]|uniref:Uncharacterized protein n=1 Tax=Piscinibacter koreensis TaxID=2742824 RepID=A0A7Y6TY94_9BURK|nr:hypothetical protein [Schlegelella koreensis]NUZ07880.1 hypothetical protein [Schlegelella koreensis]
MDSSGAPLAGAVVFLEPDAARAAVKRLALEEIAQVSRSFDPAVSVVTMGATVQFPNRGTVQHHV